MTTLGDLLTEVRRRADVPSQFVTDAEGYSYINGSLAELDDLLIASNEEYKISSASGTITSTAVGSNRFAIPSDFLKARGVDRTDGGRPRAIEPFSFRQRNAGGHYRYDPRFPDVRYYVMGGHVYIAPREASAGSYTLWYVPSFTPLASGVTALPTYMDTQAWHEFAVLGAVRKIVAKQELDISGWVAQEDRARARVVDAIAPRDAGPPRRAIDSRGILSDDDCGPGWWL
jgi:hypothetical protein